MSGDRASDPVERTDAIPARAWAVLGVCSATIFLTLLDSGSLFVAFPFIQDRFDDQASRATLSWIVSGFFIVMVSVLLVAGRIADRYGRRRVFLAGLAVYALAGFVAGSTGSAAVLIGARFAQGIGVALLSPSSLGLVLPEFPVSRRAFALGVWGTIGAVSGLASTPLAAVLVEIGTWRATFFSNGAIALVALAIGWFVLDDSRAESDRRPVDFPGAMLAIVAVGGISLVLVQGSGWGWGSAPTLGALCATAVATPVFWLRNRSHTSPLLEASVFANRRFAVASVASICCQLGFFAVYFGMPLYMEEVWGWSALEVGFGLLPFHAVPIVASVPAGRIVDVRGPRGMIAFGGVLTAACYGVLGLSGVMDSGYFWVAVLLVVASLGAMAIGGHTTVAALADVDDRILGAANAGYFMSRRLGSALGSVITAAIVGNRTGADFADVYVWVWVFGGVVYLIGGLAVWFLYPSGPLRRAGAPPEPVAGAA